MILRSFLTLLIAVITIMSPYGHAAVTSQEIQASSEAFLSKYIADIQSSYPNASRIEYHVKSLDSRLSMANCPNALDVTLKSATRIGNISLKVSCLGQYPWSIYVPAEVKLYAPAATSLITLARGTIIRREQLQLQETDISRLSSAYYSSLQQVIGMQVKRPIQPNAVITAGQLSKPLMVKRGESVMMTAQSGSLVVKIPGVAMRDGHEGEQIRVRNSKSKRIVDATVSGPGQVSVIM